MIKAIIFDCFGVLVESSYNPFKKKYFAEDKSLMEKCLELEELSNTGKINYEELNKGFAELAGISLKQTLKEIKANPPNIELLEYIKQTLKGKYKIGFLSNVGEDRMSELFNADQLSLFDDVVLSFKVGVTKPDKRIFEISARNLGVEFDECVFVDDREDYLIGATEVGMKGIHYTDFENFKTQLGTIL